MRKASSVLPTTKQMEQVLKAYREARERLADLKAQLTEDVGIKARVNTHGSSVNRGNFSTVEADTFRRERIAKELHELDYALGRIDFYIDHLPPLERSLLRDTYIKGYTLTRIGKGLGMTTNKAIAERKKAVELLGKLLDLSPSERWAILNTRE